MLKFWRTAENSWAYIVVSATAQLEMSPAAHVVTDRDGRLHRIATGGAPTPMRLTVDIPENAMALENGEGIAFDDYLLGNLKNSNEIVMMESTRNAAYKCVVERVDERVSAGRGRLETEPLFVRIELFVADSGVFTDWDDIFSITWGV
jgi:hypothetical protein